MSGGRLLVNFPAVEKIGEEGPGIRAGHPLRLPEPCSFRPPDRSIQETLNCAVLPASWFSEGGRKRRLRIFQHVFLSIDPERGGELEEALPVVDGIGSLQEI